MQVIFDLPEGPRSRIAAACILVQACAQYLININVWVRVSGFLHHQLQHNTRHSVADTITRAFFAGTWFSHQRGLTLLVQVHNLLIIIGRWEGKGVGHGSARCSTDHCKYRWFW
jgi:hypothetical protein